MREAWPWLTVALLGAFHGLNPAMGWLFAVALGMQERRREAVVRALAPIALGHALSVGLVALGLGLGRLALPARPLRLVAGSLLLGFGLFRLARPRAHPRWVGMRVGFRDLVLWSFLMASAHGAGLMLTPVLLHGEAAAHPAAPVEMVLLHTAVTLLVMGAIALLVYQTIGLELLRRAWLNLDLVWAGALIIAGVATLLLTPSLSP